MNHAGFIIEQILDRFHANLKTPKDTSRFMTYYDHLVDRVVFYPEDNAIYLNLCNPYLGLDLILFLKEAPVSNEMRILTCGDHYASPREPIELFKSILKV